ncbi:MULTISPECIES: hypothetical protein [unclassified Bradyrhizobium]|uniref:hypothetical protein n=1 Tax=unclassified Bradyrhizobium TaxID=2631580 RepID=UPI0028E64CCB|nr:MULTISPECIES: hypothetical protein [unclassified Bradyrhizobium]
MAKKARGRTEEQQMVWRLSDMLTAANFNVQHQLDLGKSVKPDLVAEREEFGRYRRYAIDVVIVSDANRLVDALDTLQEFAERQKGRDFDEYWLVSNLSYPHLAGDRKRRRRFESVRAFAMKELERMLARVTPQKPQPPKKKKGTAKTTVGKAVQANDKEIMLAIAGLMLQIDDKLDKLKEERPNSEDAKANAAEEISDLERMRAELERIRELVTAFTKGKAPEREVVKSVKTFKDSLNGWWEKRHDSLLTTTAKSALFVSSAGVLALMGANTPAALAVAGALIGGKVIKKGLAKAGEMVRDALQ